VQVVASNGRSCVLRFRGEGTYDEEYERRAGRTGFAAAAATQGW
jgi:hypothetical protein